MKRRLAFLVLGLACAVGASGDVSAQSPEPAPPANANVAPGAPVPAAAAPASTVPQPDPVQPVMARAVAPDSATNELDRLLMRMDAEEKALRTEIGTIGPALETTRARMLVRGRAYYKHVRAGLLPAGGGFDALVDHAAKVERTRRALDRDIATEAGLMKKSAELAQRLERLRIERAPLEVHREAMVRDRAALQAADERRAAFSRAFESSVHPPDYVAIYGADLGPTDTGAAGFRALKGRLPFPLPGRAEVRRVRRNGGPGLEFVAPAGTAVRSVAAGRVVFADRYDDYGLTVIVDHGDQYFSVYGNLGVSELSAGGVVPANGRVGTVGAAQGQPAMLYFELRRSAETIDPGPWLGL